MIIARVFEYEVGGMLKIFQPPFDVDRSHQICFLDRRFVIMTVKLTPRRIIRMPKTGVSRIG